MIRITRNDDINFNVDEIHGKGDRYNITFYTVNNAVNIVKHDTDVNDGIIVLNGSDLMTLGDGVMNLRIDNIAPNAGYNDGVFNSSFTKTTKYYIQAGIIVPDGTDTESVIRIVGDLQHALNAETSRSKAKDTEHDTAIANEITARENADSALSDRITANATAISNTYTKQEVDDMLDDIDVELPDNVVTDANYTHTDNNYTTTEKNKLAGIASGAEVNVQANWNETNTNSDAYIKNKPTKLSAFTNDAGYLTSYTETDPTVPSWAKQSSKPSYTASEVGALPDSTNIPSKTSDLTNDSGFVTDSNYTHTDNNYTTTEKNKLAGIASGAEVNVQSDWNVTNTSSDAYIKNKPTIPTVDTSITDYDQTNPVTGGAIYSALSQYALIKEYINNSEMESDTPPNCTIGYNFETGYFYIYNAVNEEWKPIDQSTGGGGVQSNWNETDTTSLSYIQNKPTIPTKTSDLTNDSEFVVATNDSNAITATSVKMYDGIGDYVLLTGSYDTDLDCNTLHITDLYSGNEADFKLAPGGYALNIGAARHYFSSMPAAVDGISTIELSPGYTLLPASRFWRTDAVNFVIDTIENTHLVCPEYYVFIPPKRGGTPSTVITFDMSSVSSNLTVVWKDGHIPDFLTDMTTTTYGLIIFRLVAPSSSTPVLLAEGIIYS